MKNLKKYLGIFILCAISFLGGVAINSANAESPKTTSVQAVSNVQRVSYETIYVNGHKYVVFTNGSGSDIEVVKD